MGSIKESVLGLIRHALTTAGGALVANGTIGQDELTQFAGAAVTILGIGWSVAEKYFRKKKEANA